MTLASLANSMIGADQDSQQFQIYMAYLVSEIVSLIIALVPPCKLHV